MKAGSYYLILFNSFGGPYIRSPVFYKYKFPRLWWGNGFYLLKRFRIDIIYILSENLLEENL